ncbi:MAG: NADH-quinone oxidoreductase subunit M [Buchnera aphidicola (Chaetogeoica yunlongensis)]
MLLPILLIIPFFSGILCLFMNNKYVNFSYYLSLISMTIVFILSLILFYQCFYIDYSNSLTHHWNVEYIIPWISRLGISFYLAVDRLSILMLNLTSVLGLISIFCSFDQIRRNIGMFYFSLLWTIGSMIGIFISIDLFLFFCFWELSILPIYFLVVMWGYGNNNEKVCLKRIHSANKFFIYSQISGLILLFSILALVYTNYTYNNFFTFNYEILCKAKIPILLESCIMFCFFLAFAIKIPIVPFHGWLPDFHVYSPIMGSVDLSGILLKTGIYALMRFNLPLFPHATVRFSFVIICLGIITIFYGIFVSYFQDNIKRFIAYISISHMGFVIISIYSINQLSYQGGILLVITCSLSTSALFLLSGQLFKNLGTFKISKMGGLWSKLKWIPGFFFFFIVSNFGIPGTGNFSGELMTLMGCFKFFPVIVGILSISLIFSALCSLTVVQRIYFGVMNKNNLVFISNRVIVKNFFVFLFLSILILIIGFYPKIIFDVSYSSLCNIHEIFHI